MAPRQNWGWWTPPVFFFATLIGISVPSIRCMFVDSITSLAYISPNASQGSGLSLLISVLNDPNPCRNGGLLGDGKMIIAKRPMVESRRSMGQLWRERGFRGGMEKMVARATLKSLQ
eukprot:878520-Amorphochlora_amoeboformis.AAC.1